MSLYRKYRPQNFANLVGQDHVRITLINALKLARVNHAYLFTGPRGTGKTSTARILAKAINCLNLKDAQPCEECDICRDISEGRLIDLIEIDAASNGLIADIRDLREKINFAPTRARSKVYIIDEVHMVSKDGFNALLKTLEEPPAHVYFILATTEVHKIPETILSRCQRFDFKRIDDETMVARLAYIAGEEKIQAEPQALEVIAEQAQGGLRDAIGLLEKLNVENKVTLAHVVNILGISGYASIEKLYDFLLRKDSQAGLEEIHSLYMDGFDLQQFNKNFLEFLRKKMLKSVKESKPGETAWTLKVINFFQQAYEQARFATITQLPLEIAMVQSCLPENAGTILPHVEAQVGAGASGRASEQMTGSAGATVQVARAASVGASKIVAKPATEQGAPKVPVAEKSATPVASAAAVDTTRTHQGLEKDIVTVSFDEVKNKWPRIPEHIKKPMVKRSFQECTLLKVEKNEVTIGFATKFHLEKMMETENRLDLETSLENVFGANLRIVAELKTVANQISKADEAMADEVAAMFEGEVV